MTKQPRNRRAHRRSLPRRDDIAAVWIDHTEERMVFTTKNMVLNQLKRDGPKIRRSFDVAAQADLVACSALFGVAQGLVTRHLHRLEDNGYKPTVSRLFHSASNTYLASIKVARHGYRRQYGMLARPFIETIATIISLTYIPSALDEFHAGTLKSTKCISWANKVLPPLGRYYGMLSDEFVHIGGPHASFEPLSPYSADDQALSFITSTLRGNVWMLYLAAELAFHDELDHRRYWKAEGGGVVFDPSEDEKAWMSDFLGIIDP